MTEQNFDDEQNIIIKSNTPVRCPDPCGDGGNPKITQNALIEMKSSDIVNSSLAIIHKHASDMGLDSKLKAEDTDSACMVQMILSCVCCIVCIVLIYMVFIRGGNGEGGGGGGGGGGFRLDTVSLFFLLGFFESKIISVLFPEI